MDNKFMKLRLSELNKIITSEIRRSLHESVELPRIGSIVTIRGVKHRVVEFTPMLGDHARRRQGYAWITTDDGTEAIVYRDGRIEVM